MKVHIADTSTESLRELPVSWLVFHGGEPHVNVTPELAAAVAGKNVLVDVRGGSFAELGNAAVMADALRSLRAAWVGLFTPYLPGARQDRGVPLTCVVYADFINSLAFDAVFGVDPHSLVMPSHIERFVEIELSEIVRGHSVFAGATHIICPDQGAGKRTESVADALGLPVVYARKHRDPLTRELSGFVCEPVPEGAVAVIVDDICDGGRTFLGVAAAARVPAANLRLWTTHGIYSYGCDLFDGVFSQVHSTDSFHEQGHAKATLTLLQHPVVLNKIINSTLYTR